MKFRDLSVPLFALLAMGALTGCERESARGEDADDRVIYDVTLGKLYFDADGAGGAGKILIAKLIDLPTLSASDFIVT